MTSSPAAPLVDVLMAVRNGQQFLGAAVDSILSQTYRNFRFIIVDDASTDQTPHLLQEYAAKDPRIVLLTGAGEGLATALNLGLALAEGEYVARMDADDISMPERLEIQVEFMRRCPDIVALGTQAVLIDQNGRVLRHRRLPTGSEKIRKRLEERNCLCHPTVMMRADLLKSVGGYRDKFRTSQDYDLWLRLMRFGEIENLEKPLLFYRKHGAQISTRNNACKQTIYSVGAATDHFLRRYLGKSPETVFDLNDPADIVDKLCDLYGQALDEPDRRALNRHGLRLLRYAENLPAGSRDRLYRAMQSGLTLRERLKGLLYRWL